MATRVRAKAKDLYEEDFYVWTEEQAAPLRERRFDALDLTNLIEDVEGLAGTKLSAVLNGARVTMEHLLKLQHSPARDSRNVWRASVREHRRRVQTDLTPRIEQILASEISKLYAMARDDAAAGMRDHGEYAAAEALPETCPYAFEQITATGGRNRVPRTRQHPYPQAS